MSTVAAFCEAHELRLNKNLGQHFLIDEEVLQRVVGAAEVQPDDTILEIGAGIGVLTKELLAKAKHVISIELDEKLIPLLQEYTDNPDNLTIIHGNALETNFPNEEYKIVANIPYHITSPLLRHAFLESEIQPTSMTLLIQREVAEKICNTKDHGLLTILVGLFGKPHLVQIVPPESFLPPPKVDSAILHIECFDKPLANEKIIEEVFRLTKFAFSKKRKMLSNSIGSLEGGMDLQRGDVRSSPARGPRGRDEHPGGGADVRAAP